MSKDKKDKRPAEKSEYIYELLPGDTLITPGPEYWERENSSAYKRGRELGRKVALRWLRDNGHIPPR